MPFTRPSGRRRSTGRPATPRALAHGSANAQHQALLPARMRLPRAYDDAWAGLWRRSGSSAVGCGAWRRFRTPLRRRPKRPRRSARVDRGRHRGSGGKRARGRARDHGPRPTGRAADRTRADLRRRFPCPIRRTRRPRCLGGCPARRRRFRHGTRTRRARGHIPQGSGLAPVDVSRSASGRAVPESGHPAPDAGSGGGSDQSGSGAATDSPPSAEVLTVPVSAPASPTTPASTAGMDGTSRGR